MGEAQGEQAEWVRPGQTRGPEQSPSQQGIPEGTLCAGTLATARQPCWGLPIGDRGQGTAGRGRVVPWRNGQGAARSPAGLHAGPQLSPEAAGGGDSLILGWGLGARCPLCSWTGDSGTSLPGGPGGTVRWRMDICGSPGLTVDTGGVGLFRPSSLRPAPPRLPEGPAPSPPRSWPGETKRP